MATLTIDTHSLSEFEAVCEQQRLTADDECGGQLAYEFYFSDGATIRVERTDLIGHDEEVSR